MLLNFNINILFQDENDVELAPHDIQTMCLGQFSSTDFIMEPGIFNTLKRFVIILLFLFI